MKVKVHQCSPIYLKFPIASWLIKWIQKTNYSHYAIQFNSVIIDATGHDVLPHTPYSFFKRYRVEKTFILEVEDLNFEQAIYWALPYLKRKYGFLQVFGLMLMSLGLIKNNPWGKNSEHLICNELIVLFISAYKDFQSDDSDNYDLNKTEKLLQKYCSSIIKY